MTRQPFPWRVLLFGLLLLVTFAAIALYIVRVQQPKPSAPPPAPSLPAQIIEAAPTGPPPPAALAQQIAALGQNFDGRVGIVVRSVEEGWVAHHRGGGLYPQQSLSKTWVAAAVLGAVDAGQFSLSDTVTLTQADLTIFHQPIRKRIGEGSYTAALGELMRLSMTQSDNTANDALFRTVGGQEGVGRFLAGRQMGEIAIGPGEKILQTQAAGLRWNDAFSHGRTFWEVREELPMLVRAWAISDYATNPSDGATAFAIAEALSRLKRGELLSRGSTAYLLDLMEKSKTGPDRLRGGLSDGWRLAHKTGTGQVAGDYATAYNDVGILTSPSGKNYAVVVLIGSTQLGVPARQALMSDVTQSVIALE